MGLEALSSILTPISRFKLYSQFHHPKKSRKKKTAIGGIVGRWNAFRSCLREWQAKGPN